jgi:hypothetical protein
VSDVPELQWNEWSAPSRAKIERTGVHLFTKAFRDANPVYHSEALAQEAGFGDVPCPPTYTFVITHGGGWPDLQPEAPKVAIEENATLKLNEAKGLFLHGEQHFTYHRTPVVGEVLQARRRTAEPYEKASRRGTMQVTHYETEWADLDGNPVVTETIVGLFIPEA